MTGATEAERQAVERIMRKAEDMGLDPQRVARALQHDPPPPTEHQATEEPQRRSVFGRNAARRFARPS